MEVFHYKKTPLFSTFQEQRFRLCVVVVSLSFVLLRQFVIQEKVFSFLTRQTKKNHTESKGTIASTECGCSSESERVPSLAFALLQILVRFVTLCFSTLRSLMILLKYKPFDFDLTLIAHNCNRGWTLQRFIYIETSMLHFLRDRTPLYEL